jgi:hypothetical protein
LVGKLSLNRRRTKVKFISAVRGMVLKPNTDEWF